MDIIIKMKKYEYSLMEDKIFVLKISTIQNARIDLPNLRMVFTKVVLKI